MVAAEPVVHLPAAVQAHDHVVHLAVRELDDVVVHQKAVGGQREAEALAAFLLAPAGVGDQPLDHVPVHQRLAAEEVHVQRPVGAGVLDQKVDGPRAHVVGHQRALAPVAALAGEAVFAVEVARVGRVQAQRLDERFLGRERQALVGVGREQLAGGLERRDVRGALPDRGLVDARVVPVFFEHPRDDLLRRGALKQADDVVGQRVDRVDRAAVRVQHDVKAVQRVAMDHGIFLC